MCFDEAKMEQAEQLRAAGANMQSQVKLSTVRSHQNGISPQKSLSNGKAHLEIAIVQLPTAKAYHS